MQITSFTPGFVMSLTDLMCPGLLLGTISTSLLVANSTGLSTSPFAYSAAGCFGLAAANTSAGAPCSICVSSIPEPPNVYFALGSIIGNTFVSDAAANTVGREPEAAVVVLAGAEAAVDVEAAALLGLVELELLPDPQPTANAEIPIAAATAADRLNHSLFITDSHGCLRRVRTEFEQPTRIVADDGILSAP